MNSVQRCMRAIRHEETDRVPVVPLVISHAAKLASVPFCQHNDAPGDTGSGSAEERRVDLYRGEGRRIHLEPWLRSPPSYASREHVGARRSSGQLALGQRLRKGEDGMLRW